MTTAARIASKAPAMIICLLFPAPIFTLGNSSSALRPILGRLFQKCLKRNLQRYRPAFLAAERDLLDDEHELVLFQRVDESRHLAVLACNRGFNLYPLYTRQIFLVRLTWRVVNGLRHHAGFMRQASQFGGNL